jgi:hypothetical protein
MGPGEIESDIRKIKERNARVEADKAWETSLARRAMIAAATFAIVYVFLLTINASQPALSALVPTIGYMLSTISLPFLKNLWIKNFYKK